MTPPYDAVLLLSFGGPEAPDDVLPFLDNVLRGKHVPHERKLEVARHYDLFGGRSPLNDHNRALLAALRAEFDAHALGLPLYWGNRNWHPLLLDTLQRMQADGVRRALAFVTSAYSSYSGCRQYLEDVRAAREKLGPGAPEVEKLRPFFDHPGFVAANAERLRDALGGLDADARARAAVVFSAHSIPVAMARTSRYEEQLRGTCALVAQAAGVGAWTLAFQSRSGPPSQPWLEPDILDHLRALHAQGAREVVLAPVGFVSDHMEVVYDLDTEAQALARELGLTTRRAGTPGSHPRFVAMVRELVQERLSDAVPPCVCPPDCCPAPQRPAVIAPPARVV